MSNQLQQLWVKESIVPDPLYVDLFVYLRNTRDFRENVVEQVVVDDVKDDALATQYRQCGNEFTAKRDFIDAIEQYNKSLCYAKNGTTTQSLAYANRAFCFLSLELFDECLADIEFAKGANYPERLLSKLEQRKDICLKQMQTADAKRAPFEPQLSFPPNDTIRCMAAVLAAVRTDEFGRHFIAQCDIPEDRVIMVEKPLAKLLDVASKYRRCYVCLKENTNLIPCGMCTKAMFCRGACTEIAKYHKYECNMKFVKFFDGKTGSSCQNCVKFVLRSIVDALDAFSSADELMDFVELFRADSSSDEIIVADGSVESLLGIFLTHQHLVCYEIGQLKISIISCIAYDHVMANPNLQTKFPTKKTRRFLMHLVTQLALIFTANNISLQDWSEKWSDIIEGDAKSTFGAGLFNVSSHFNHACMPNVIRLTTTDRMVVKTIRAIRKGEQIFVRYGIDPNWPTHQRQQHLRNLCGFFCKCKLCLSNGPMLTESSVLSTELANLSTELGPLVFLRVKDSESWDALKKKLFQFVKKYEHMPVSKSIILCYEFIRMILTRELSYLTNV